MQDLKCQTNIFTKPLQDEVDYIRLQQEDRIFIYLKKWDIVTISGTDYIFGTVTKTNYESDDYPIGTVVRLMWTQIKKKIIAR